MLKRILVGVGVIILVAAIGLFVWVRSVLAGDGVRTTIAAQLTKSLGQPVSIGGVSVSIFPRIAMNLNDVAIGQSGRITVGTLQVGTDLRALLSRRIEHADVKLKNARVTLPLPVFAVGSSAHATPEQTSGGRSAVELVSVDDIALSDVQIVSGGRTLRGDVDLAVEGHAVTIKNVTLKADASSVTMTGRITDLSALTGDLSLKAGNLSFLELVAFVTDFSSGAGLAGASRSAPSSSAPSSMNLTLSIDADKATFGALALTTLSGRARITGDAITLDPVRFGVFGGTYDGTLAVTLGQTPDFRLNASLSGVDMAAVMTFAGSPGVMTGKLSGKINLSGRGTTADAVLKTTHGSSRVDIVDGSVKGLGLVRGVVLAASMRQDSRSQLSGASANEPFSRLGATLTVASGAATTEDLRFESKDLLLTATGGLRLDGSLVDLAGPIQLSDELSKQAGRDLLRYTQKDGRVTIPATVTGSAENLHVGVDAGDMAKRALTNRATEEAKKALQKKLGLIIK